MLFYKIEFESEKALESGDRQSRRVRSRLKALTADANARTKGTIAFFVSDFEGRRGSIGAALFVDAVSMNRRDLAEIGLYFGEYGGKYIKSSITLQHALFIFSA